MKYAGTMVDALFPTMTLRDFENGYWYLEQLKNFAERIGIPAAKKLRKNELEKAIVTFLRAGKAALPTKRSLRRIGVKDVDCGLNLKLRIKHYTCNRETKEFIVEQARLMAPWPLWRCHNSRFCGRAIDSVPVRSGAAGRRRVCGGTPDPWPSYRPPGSFMEGTGGSVLTRAEGFAAVTVHAMEKIG
jgi:hypothetical protein